MAESADEKPWPSFERAGTFNGGHGPLWIMKIRRELRENGNPITDTTMFLAIIQLLSQNVREILLFHHPIRIQDILAKATNGKEITRSEVKHLIKTISAHFPAKPNNEEQAKSPQDQLFQLRQYEYETRNEYFLRARALRDTLSFSAYWTSEPLVLNFIEGLRDPVLTSLVLEKRESDPSRVVTLEDANFWIGEARNMKDVKDRAALWATMGLRAHDKKFTQMWYGEKVEGKCFECFG